MNALVIGLVLLIIALVCVVVFYPVGKDRCMKSAKNSKDDSAWCITTTKPTDDGSCSPQEEFRKRRKMLEKYEAGDPFTATNCITSQPPWGTGGIFKNSLPGPNGNKIIDDIPWLTNNVNDEHITRQMYARWPEFSWMRNGVPEGQGGRRIFQQLPQDVSRIGYSDNGKAFHVICPVFGSASLLGNANIEFTVTKTRGYVDEGELHPDGAVAGNDRIWTEFDIGVTVKIWFSNPSGLLGKLFAAMDGISGWQTPTSKPHAIEIPLYDAETNRDYLRIRHGQNPAFNNPPSRQHPEAAGVCYLYGYSKGPTDKYQNKKALVLSQFLVDQINDESNGMFTKNNHLTWNLWAGCPHAVDPEEYSNHTQHWREAINTPQGAQHTNKPQMVIENGREVPAPGPATSYGDLALDVAALAAALVLPDFVFNRLY